MADMPHCSRFHHTAYPLEVTFCHHVVLTEIAGQWSVQHKRLFCLLLRNIPFTLRNDWTPTLVNRLVNLGWSACWPSITSLLTKVNIQSDLLPRHQTSRAKSNAPLCISQLLLKLLLWNEWAELFWNKCRIICLKHYGSLTYLPLIYYSATKIEYIIAKKIKYFPKKHYLCRYENKHTIHTTNLPAAMLLCMWQKT